MLARQVNKLSSSNEQQLIRWNRIVSSWERAGNEGDVLVLGDLNLNWLNWDNLYGLNGKCSAFLSTLYSSIYLYSKPNINEKVEVNILY